MAYPPVARTISRTISLPILFLSAAVSIVWGVSIASQPFSDTDFRAVYYGTRCLLQHHNPYDVSELESVVAAEHGERPQDIIPQHQAITLYVNLPSTFVVLAPIAVLPFWIAQAFWLSLVAILLVSASLSMWNLAESYAPGVALVLTSVVLANSVVLFSAGNAAGVAVPLCVLAVWCFLRGRFVTVGVFFMALSLAMKPHDSGFVWLYFLLVGGVSRRRALQSLAVTAIVYIVGVIWVTQVAPNWLTNWEANLSVISSHGYINDPGPASIAGFHTLGPVIDLQSIISVFRDDPHFYNLLSYLICGAFLLVWVISASRSRISRDTGLLALATIAPLTMLITYHRPWDAKLLLLVIPATAMLFSQNCRRRWLALFLSTTALLSVGDIAMSVYLVPLGKIQIPATGFWGRILTILIGRPIPIILLVTAIFYLWAYLRCANRDPRNGLEASHLPTNVNQQFEQ